MIIQCQSLEYICKQKLEFFSLSCSEQLGSRPELYAVSTSVIIQMVSWLKHEADQSALEPNMWSHTFICTWRGA